MDKAVVSWHLARALLQVCDSEDDLRMVRQALRDTETRERLLSTLIELFHTLKRDAMLTPKTLANTEPLSQFPRGELVEHLDELFRQHLAMKNDAVEEWLRSRFDVRNRIGKSSLREYLRRVLRDGPPNLGRQIVAQAEKEFPAVVGRGADLRRFWDKLDAWTGGDR